MQVLNSSLIWPECRFSEGSVGELPWAHHALSLLDRMEFGRARLRFILTVWFPRERDEALLSVATR
jgi:hypothetical protein